MKKNISGIYAIINTINNKRYIGSSKSVYYRWKQNHLPQLKAGIHFNRHLQNAWKKYGEDSFKFEVIEECEPVVILQREGYYIEKYKSWEREYGYNLTRIVDNLQVFSDETISKRTITRTIADYWTTGTNKKILDMFQKGESKIAIAKKLGITRSAVYSCLEHNGLHKNTGKGNEIKLTDEVKKKIEDLRKQNKPWSEIIEIVDIGKTQTYRSELAGDGMYCTDKVKRKNYRTVTQEIIEKVDRLRKQGKTWEEIEEELGVSRFALHANGITKKFKPIKGKPRNKMTEEKKSEIKQLILQGKKLKEVSKITGIAQSTIRFHNLHTLCD